MLKWDRAWMKAGKTVQLPLLFCGYIQPQREKMYESEIFIQGFVTRRELRGSCAMSCP